MLRNQRKTFWILFVLGLIYFALFIFPNSFGAGTSEILLDSSSDEYVTYPNVLRILTPGETFFDTRANLFLYEDYHYGYPFYALSALTLLPVRLILGADFQQPMQLNLLLLRQVISVLPMLLAAGFLVYLQTRFLSPFKSAALFIFLLTIRGVVRNHIWWWHPDALAVLCVVLTIFFLDQDRLRFGRNFYLAAAACGMAAAIKLLGVFFFLTIPIYMLVGLRQGKINLGKAVWASGLFLLVMASVLIFSNPFLFSDEQRARMLEIQAQKSEELRQGYEHDDPMYYNKGPQWWATTLEKWYAPPWFLLFLAGSMAAGCWWGGEKRLLYWLIFSWVIPYSIYLLYFVAVKPDHYWLPVLLPLFSCCFSVFDILFEGTKNSLRRFSISPFSWRRAVQLLVIALLAVQFLFQLVRPVSGNIAIYQSAVERGMAQLQSGNLNR